MKAVVLVPTRELVDQVRAHLWELMYYCRDVLTVMGLSGESVEAQQARLRDRPDIVVATPARLLAHLKSGALSLRDSCEMLVVDEADLVLSFGHSADMHSLAPFLPRSCQCFLMSATLSDRGECLRQKRALWQAWAPG